MDNVFRRYWTDAERSRLLATMRSRAGALARRDAAWLTLLVSSGLRIGEFSRLNVGDGRQALATGWLFIPSEIRKGFKARPRLNRSGRLIVPKAPPDHQVPLTRPIEEALEALLRIQREMGGQGEDAEPLVLARNGTRMSIRGYQFKCAQWCFEAKIGAGSPHFARHTKAMRIMQRSTSRDPRGLVQAALGHASIESTAIYTRVSKEDLAAEMARIDGAARARKADLRRLYEERRAA